MTSQGMEPERSARRRKRTQFKLTPRFWAFLALVGLIYIGSAYAVGFLKIARLGSQIRAAEEELEQVLRANNELREHLQYMESDEYVESVARSELGLVKPGETAVVIVKTDADKDPIATERLSPGGGNVPAY